MKEYPGFGGKPIGATGTLFIEVEGVDALHDRLKPTVKIVMPIVTQFYGMREFAIEDPDGYVITFRGTYVVTPIEHVPAVQSLPWSGAVNQRRARHSC